MVIAVFLTLYPADQYKVLGEWRRAHAKEESQPPNKRLRTKQLRLG